MSIRSPRETVNLAELYGQELMPWAGPGGARHRVARPRGAMLSGHRSPRSASAQRRRRRGRARATSSSPAARRQRKSRNLTGSPAATLSLRLDGIDLVLEGEAQRVVDRATLDQVAAAFRAGGWPAEVDGDALTAAYSAQSAGPPPWHLYRLDVHTAFGVGLREPHGASRWRF